MHAAPPLVQEKWRGVRVLLPPRAITSREAAAARATPTRPARRALILTRVPRQHIASHSRLARTPRQLIASQSRLARTPRQLIATHRGSHARRAKRARIQLFEFSEIHLYCIN